ncbi:hypothetical protein I79_013127 [Cricetulus griseus]|uniref:Uncharacterized protein n=1 Tax=Cricetulus griseus TaxID=10029 RepID=G3HQM2_CRIGR|nr:hypothetical protein I79_013127 [Cricetulus griseus]
MFSEKYWDYTHTLSPECHNLKYFSTQGNLPKSYNSHIPKQYLVTCFTRSHEKIIQLILIPDARHFRAPAKNVHVNSSAVHLKAT